MKPSLWFLIIIVYSSLTLLLTYLITPDSPIAFLRIVFGIVFVAFLPGYCLLSILFTRKNKLDVVEELVLSVGLSFGLAGLVGLFLGLSPIGIFFTPVTISLGGLVLVLATVAFVLKLRSMGNKKQENGQVNPQAQASAELTA